LIRVMKCYDCSAGRGYDDKGLGLDWTLFVLREGMA
jgi:hypothetical protein